MPTPKSADERTYMKVQAVLPKDLFDRLSELAGAGERPVAAEVRLALKAWVENADKEQRS